MSWRGWHTRTKGSSTATLLNAALLVNLLVASAVAHADVPTATDVAGCNQEAHEALRGLTASPTVKDEAQAKDARKGNQGTVERTDPTGTITQSPDPQLNGMDAEGAKDPTYRAAYRVCMRKAGF